MISTKIVLLDFFNGAKKFGKIAKKAYIPSREDRLESFAKNEAKKENDITNAKMIYSKNADIPLDDPRIREFEMRARKKADEPRKPIFENVDKGLDSLDKAFGKPRKANLTTPNNEFNLIKKPRVLDDPWGNPL